MQAAAHATVHYYCYFVELAQRGDDRTIDMWHGRKNRLQIKHSQETLLLSSHNDVSLQGPLYYMRRVCAGATMVSQNSKCSAVAVTSEQH